MTKKQVVTLAVGVVLLDFVLATPLLVADRDLLRLNYSFITWSFAAAGAIAWIRRPDHPMGRLLMLVAVLWTLLNLGEYRVPVLWTGMMLTRHLWILALAYLILAFPETRLRTFKNKAVFGAATLLATIPQGLFVIFEDGADRLPESYRALNLVHVEGLDHVSDAAQVAGDVGALALLAVVAAEIGRRWRRTTKPARRAFTPVVVGGFLTIAISVAVNILTEQIPFLTEHRIAIRRASSALFAVVPFGLLFGLLRAQARRARIGDLVVELRELPVPRRLQDLLRKSLDDPSLIVGVWVPQETRYVTPDGGDLALPEDELDRVTTFLDRNGEPLAAIVHDRALLDDPKLVESVKAAAQLAVENERLQEEVLAQLGEVHASRARIVEAADEERRRIERNLHDGAQQRLVSVSLALRMLASNLPSDPEQVRSALANIAGQLGEGLTELRDLARGIHPVILTESGLVAAIESLAERATTPVRLTHDVSDRFPERVEVAAYYVVAEALANVDKHAHASSAEVRVTVCDGVLLVEVSDDGIGTPASGTGTGVHGLADRVAAVGGSLSVVGEPGHGTKVAAEIPLTVPQADDVERLLQASPVLAQERVNDRDASTPPLLSCRGVHYSYGADPALDNVDLDVYPNELVGVLGTNGAGKSTLLRVLAGLSEPAAGTVYFGGDDITYFPAERRAALGLTYVRGGSGVFGPLSVMDNLLLFGNRFGKREVGERMERVFKVFPDLRDRRRELAATLSRGQQQMLALAKGLIAETRVLLVDELTLGLAPQMAERLLEVTERLNREGVTVLFVDQSIEAAAKLAHRVYFLDGHEVVFEGSPNELGSRQDLPRSVFLATGAEELAHA